MKGDRKIPQYVEAMREMRGLEQAVKDDGTNEARKHALLQSRIRVKLARGRLTGGELRRAGQILDGAQ